jgi:chorismate mutase
MQSTNPFENSKDKPFIMAGPCSAESEYQVLSTARALKKRGVDLFRAGLWKPRTRPNNFEGVGTVGLPWLKKVKDEIKLPVTTEVANARHVELALEFEIDVLWLGARTTTNPFSVQDIADALSGVDVPVIIKNPINPDMKLWLGAVERIQRAGVRNIAVIHRGFNFFNNKKYRNSPLWEIPIEFRSLMPDIKMICDVSHIGGNREILGELAQQAMDLYYDGLMIEVHPKPDQALSDAKQQITPLQFERLIKNIILRREILEESGHQKEIKLIRNHIDELDEHLIQLLGKRMVYAEEIGTIKRENDIPILQSVRWNQILEQAYGRGTKYGLSNEFVEIMNRQLEKFSSNGAQKRLD